MEPLHTNIYITGQCKIIFLDQSPTDDQMLSHHSVFNREYNGYCLHCRKDGKILYPYVRIDPGSYFNLDVSGQCQCSKNIRDCGRDTNISLRDLCVIRISEMIKNNPADYKPFGEMMGTCLEKRPAILDTLPEEVRVPIDVQLNNIRFCYHCEILEPENPFSCIRCRTTFCYKCMPICTSIILRRCERCCNLDTPKTIKERHFIEDHM